MLYCNITFNLAGLESEPVTHHHHSGEAHPSPAPSLLQLSLARRLAVAGSVIALICIAALWATR